MTELKGEGDCPYCGKHYKRLELHKCKEKPVKKKSSKGEQETTTSLVEADDYLSAGVHIGTKHKSNFMKNFIFKIRPDGLAIFDIKKIDERLKIICDYLGKLEPDEVFIVCKRDNGTKPLKMLSLATGINVMAGRYLPGTLTNPNNDSFIEPKVVLITDTWYDKQALADAKKSGAVIIALTNSNSTTNNIDIALPCNNRGHKSLAFIFWIIAREYCKTNKLEFEFKKERFI